MLKMLVVCFLNINQSVLEATNTTVDHFNKGGSPKEKNKSSRVILPVTQSHFFDQSNGVIVKGLSDNAPAPTC